MSIKRDTPEWLAERRKYITSTALPAILGLSPYRGEQDLADEMDGLEEQISPERARFMRIGKAMEPAIRAEEEVEHGIKLRAVNRFIVHPTIPWAATSLDFERVGERCIVEAKDSESGRWSEGLPQDVEAQVRWQMGCAGYPKAHVAHIARKRLDCYDVEHDPAIFDGLVELARDFLYRKAAGGPLAQTPATLKRRFPSDNGTEMPADEWAASQVRQLAALREQRKQVESLEEQIESAIKGRMGDTAILRGDGWHVTWKRTKDSEQIDWKSIADGLLRTLPESDRAAIVGLHASVRSGFRPFRLVFEKED